MKTYSVGSKVKRVPRRLWAIIVSVVVVVVLAGIFVQRWYNDNLRPVSTSTQTQVVAIAQGATLSQIAGVLQSDKLIRSSQAFEWYVSARNDRDKLQAGTYSFSPSESTMEIADAIVAGRVATNLVTILPGQRLDQVRAAFITAGFQPSAVDAALEPSQYRASFPALADNPANATLEGFLYPDTFEKTSTTEPHQIIAESLTEMQQRLTPDIRNGFAAEGLNVYQGVTLASIVEQEVPGQNDRNQAAQVFLKRLQIGMPLGSDVTAYYGSVKAGQPPSVSYDSAYNTLLHTGFPPGPIGTISDSSLSAVAHPASTNWLYFVTGDDGVTHFAQTLQEHNANVSQYCHKLCQQ